MYRINQNDERKGMLCNVHVMYLRHVVKVGDNGHNEFYLKRKSDNYIIHIWSFKVVVKIKYIFSCLVFIFQQLDSF